MNILALILLDDVNIIVRSAPSPRGDGAVMVVDLVARGLRVGSGGGRRRWSMRDGVDDDEIPL